MIFREVKKFLRKSKALNQIENEQLTEEFNSRIIAIKEYNSQVIYKTHYIPKAIYAILKEENYLTSERGAMPRATAMMMSDLANGVIDEFYRPKE